VGFKPVAGATQIPAATPSEIDDAREPEPYSGIYANDETTRSLWAVRLLRAGALLIIGYQSIDALNYFSVEHGLADARGFIHLFNVAVGLLLLAMSFTAWMRRHWRAGAFAASSTVIASTALICFYRGITEPLFIATFLFLIGAGTLVPWKLHWQLALSAFGLATLAVVTLALPHSHPVDFYYWLALGTVTGLACAATGLGQGYREAMAKQVRALRMGHEALHAEMTLRAVAQQKVKESEQALRTIFDVAADMIAVNRSSDGAYLDANRAFFDSGFTLEEMQQRAEQGVSIWIDPAQRGDFWRQIRDCGRVHNMEAALRRKDGGTSYNLVSAVAVELRGEPCVVTFIRNINELKEAERKVRESEATMRRVFDAIPDAVIIARMKDAAFIDANSAVEALGLTRDEALSGQFLANQLFPSGDARREFAARLRADGVFRNQETDVRRRDGTNFPALVSSTLVTLNDEPCAVVVVRDISAIKATDNRLRESEATLRKIFDASLDAISVARASDGRFVDVNREFLALWPGRADIIGSTDLDLDIWVHPQQRAELARRLDEAGEVRNMEVEFYTEGRRVESHLLSAARVTLRGEPCIVAFTRNISDLKQAARDLEAAREAALAASRAKSEFLSSMSHEIRTPLNSILGMADLLTETEVTAEQRHLVNTMVTNGNALLQIINDVLDLARIESGRMTLERAEFDLRELIEKTLETLAVRSDEKGIALTARIDPDVPTALIGDQFRLRQVLINLIGNAVKFTQHGEVSVTVERDAASTRAGALLFAVRDTGIGVAPEKLEAIFSPFSQADSSTTRKYGGSGLGLSIVQRLVTLMGGEVSAKSELRKGSTFSFTAKFDVQSGPRLAAPPSVSHAANGKVSPQIERIDTRPLKILLADDSPDNRALIRAYLKKTPYQLDEVEDGREAVSKFQEKPYDLVLMDIQMPVMDGYEAVKSIRSMESTQHATRTPIIALTASAFEEAIIKARRAGCDAHVAKPVKKATLLKAILDATQAAPPASATSNGHSNGAKNGSVVVHLDPALSDLVPGFLARKANDARAVLSAIDGADFDAVAEIAHKLKGEGGSYGLDRISEFGRALENAIKTRDAAEVRKVGRELEFYLASLDVVYDSAD
jgi:PAS domain S-box-containing protein